MAGDFIKSPEPQDDISGAPLEALREELNHLNKGLDELLRRRRAVTTAINIKIEDSRMHLMSSDEYFAKATGQYESDASVPKPGSTGFIGADEELPIDRRRF